MTDTARWSPFLVLVAVLGGLLARDEEVRSPIQETRVLAAAVPAEVRDEPTNVGAPVATDRYSEAPIEEEATPAPIPTAWSGGRVVDLQHRPVDIATVKVVPADGEVRDWQQRVLRGLPDLEREIRGNHFRVKVPADRGFHLAVMTKGGRWWLVENVQPGRERLRIEVPVEQKKKVVKPSKPNVFKTPPGSKIQVTDGSFTYSGIVFSTTGLNPTNRNSKSIEGKEAIRYGLRYIEGANKNAASLEVRTALTAAVTNTLDVQVDLPDPVASPHSPNTQGVVTWGYVPAKTGNVRINGFPNVVAVTNPQTSGFQSINGLRNSWIAENGLITFGNYQVLQNADMFSYLDKALDESVADIKANAPRCLPTRAWDEDTSEEFYCWDLAPRD